jgi:hypothetical protein
MNMSNCEGGSCTDYMAEDIWLEDQVRKLKKAIPDELYQEIKQIIAEARESSPISPYLSDIALISRFGDVFESLVLMVMFDMDDEELSEQPPS